ncbi:amphi-Trp domain-containing protein [Halovenus marina]|jgi:amphi-Trp domain-containing protein|uniref:amphi-Trp domain-containing protein n=1 Tax=Halovenus marina TaxID=3396621 RepID=UPI003F57F5A0
MPEEVLFKSEQTQDRAEIASVLRTVADNLESGDSLTFTQGSESVTMDPPARPTFEVKAEREGPTGGPHELSVELELEWDERDEGESADDADLLVE